MAIFNKDMVDLATKNTFWQKEVYRDSKVQIVLMSIPAGEEIGLETHPADQTTFIVEGDAQVTIDESNTKAGPNHLEGDGAAGVVLLRLVDDAHSSLAEQAQDAVVADPRR